jgi:hypothetical protein
MPFLTRSLETVFGFKLKLKMPIIEAVFCSNIEAVFCFALRKILYEAKNGFKF